MTPVYFHWSRSPSEIGSTHIQNHSLCSSSNSIVFFKTPFSLGINSQRSRFFPSRMNLLLEGGKVFREANKEPQKSFLIAEMEKKHGDIHYTFTRLTNLKRRELVVPFYPVLLFYFGHGIHIMHFHRIF